MPCCAVTGSMRRGGGGRRRALAEGEPRRERAEQQDRPAGAAGEAEIRQRHDGLIPH
jgi:hypothetical protein